MKNFIYLSIILISLSSIDSYSQQSKHFNAGQINRFSNTPGQKNFQAEDTLGDVLNERLLNGYAADDNFGYGAASAGDVNGDGYDDVIVGAPFNDAGGTLAGRAYIYFGGTIFNSVPDVILTGDSVFTRFGYSCSSAGDVNGDGYSDVILGAYSASNNKGKAYIFFGGSLMNNIPDLVMSGETTGSFFGISVSGAGDLNGDGFSDVIVGASAFNSSTGRAYIFFGGFNMNNVADIRMTGTLTNSLFGVSVSDAGDVNGDGFADAIIGASNFSSNTGRAYLVFGGANMDSVVDKTMNGESTFTDFGISVSSAGDINGDGYSDVIVGAQRYLTFTGRAYVFYGGASMDVTADVTMTGENTNDFFGNKVSNAGDMNGDGYSDVMISATAFSSIDNGKVYFFKGGSNMDIIPDKILSGENASDTFGAYISSAGDINNDGNEDVIIAATGHDQNGNNSGRAYLYLNSMTGQDADDITFDGGAESGNFGQSVAAAGDVNGDGFNDIVIGDPFATVNDTGKAYIYFGGTVMNNIPDLIFKGERSSSRFGHSVSSADINADGFSDVIIGSYGYNSVGRVYIYKGGSVMDNIVDAKMTGDSLLGYFGNSVTTGDLNGDGFPDVIVGSFGYSSYTGRVYIFKGGINIDTVEDLAITGYSSTSSFGHTVSSAGDANGDGFTDFLVGASTFNNIGRAYLYFGGSNLNGNIDMYFDGLAVNDDFGQSVSSAGDFNGDGYSDIIVGAKGADPFGKAYVYYGGISIDNTADVTFSGEIQPLTFGISVSSAGDVNNDGYSDVIVGDYLNSSYNANAGKAFLYFGGSSPNNASDITMVGDTAVSTHFGESVSSAGDINNDGYPDVIIGATNSNSGTGRAHLFYSTPQQISPRIISAKDIPFDQGGKVLLKWRRSGYDTRGTNIVTGYLIQRSVPPGTIGYQWEQIATVPATNENVYSYSAPTYNDSMSNNNGTTFFRVTAQTINASEYWRSNIISGFSVDNLAPFAPLNLAGAPDNNSINLTWEQNQDADLHHYIIYRDGIELATSVNNIFDDATVIEDSTYDYQVAAVDIHGNISPLSNLVTVTLDNFGTLNLTIIMEGFYDASLNNMRITDSLKVYLRNSTSPFAVVDSSSSVIDFGTLSGSFQISNAPTGNYYIQTKHRNTIETWSAAPVSYTQGGTVNYDFTTSSSQAFGDNMKQVDASPLRFAIYSGDVNQDDVVDLTDIINVFNDANVFLSGYVATDITGDDFVDLSDLTITFNNSNAFVSVITP